MNKKFLLIFVSILLIQIPQNLFAIKAKKGTSEITQPDGTKLKVQLNGDEFSHYHSTEDGLILKKNSKGFFTYATTNNEGNLIESEVIAKDVLMRSATDQKFIKSLNLTLSKEAVISKSRKSKLKSVSKAPMQKSYSALGSPKALVILANFSDKTFVVSNPQVVFQNLCTQVGYSDNGATGSCRDYFIASSMGQFSPEFIVVGPVTLPKTLDYYGANDSNGDDEYPAQMIVDACAAADAAGVDFTQFDTDGDGYVDNVFVYYAGYNEAENGPDNTVWPHRWSLSEAGITSGITFDGKKINDYSCTSELKGSSGSSMCGVGTFCHEFGHVLGLPDFYNTTTSTKKTLDTWDVMDYGPYLNDGCTPPLYSCYEKFCLGFLTPEEIKTASNNTLLPVYAGTNPLTTTSGQSYILSQTTHNLNANAPSPSQFFMVEYRKHTGWDTYLGESSTGVVPSDGMLIWHIDYLQSAWDDNAPNNYTGTSQTSSSHMRVYLQPLSGQTKTPGTSFTTGSFTPTLWNGTTINRPITSIITSSDSINFKLMGGESALGTFQANNASNVTSTSFTANWTESANATKYILNVYKKTTTTGTTQNEVINESFDGFSGGSTGSGAATSALSSLDSKTDKSGWTGAQIFEAGGTIKIGTSSKLGYITTPSIDLSANSGAFNISFKTMAWSNDATSLKIYLNDALVKTVTGLNNSSYTLYPFSIDLTGGTSTSKIKLEGNVASKGRFFLEDLVISNQINGTIQTNTYLLTNQEVTGTSFNVTGLEAGVTYYYTVKAANSSDISLESNEIIVSGATNIDGSDKENEIKIWGTSFGIYISSPKAQRIKIYDALGVLFKDEIINEGVQNVSLPNGRIYFVKTEKNTFKVFVK